MKTSYSYLAGLLHTATGPCSQGKVGNLARHGWRTAILDWRRPRQVHRSGMQFSLCLSYLTWEFLSNWLLLGGSGTRAVMIPLISGSWIGITIWTKEPEPEPIPQWNRLQEWNRLNPKLNLTIEGRDKIQGNVLQTIFIKLWRKWPVFGASK